jgi:hypothetical protein
MTSTVSPSRWSTTVTRAALHAIPPGQARERWQHELVAELYGLSPREQVRHTLGVITRVPSLRAAVTARDRVIEEHIMRKPIRCRLHLHHFQVASTEDGSRFLRCRRCGKEDDFAGRAHWSSSLGGGAN